MPFVPTVPMIAALYGALLGLFAVALTVRVIVKRVRLRVNAGDGGLLNAVGLSRSLGPTNPRQSGAGLTLLVTVGAAGLILYALWVR